MLDADTVASPVSSPILPLPRTLQERPGCWALHDLVVSEHVRDDLPTEGYRIEVRDGRARLEASGQRGFRYARVTLEEVAAARGGDVPGLVVEDAPTLPRRGVIEGFYGEPWSHHERLAFFALARRLKLNSYVYAPKDDPYHRVRWRDPYPDDELQRLTELARAATTAGVEFVVALHPAGSMTFSDDAEHARLAAKAEQLFDAGIPSVALLFDDVPSTPVHEDDRARFGHDGAALGAAHALTARRFFEEVLRPRRPETDLLVVPMDYAGIGGSDYRSAFAAGLPAQALVWWTGRDIVVGEVTRADIDAAADVFGDRLLLWDNFPVNDFDRGRAFLGPLTGRTGDLEGSGLRGAWSNPMVEYAAGGFGIAAFADWAWNPRAYESGRAAAQALRIVAGPSAERLAPLVRTLSSWPPSAQMDPELAAAASAVLDGSDPRELRARLESMRRVADEPADDELWRTLQPWIVAAADMADAGLAALDLLAGTAAGAGLVRAALSRAEGHSAKVATDVIPAFVRQVLVRRAANG